MSLRYGLMGLLNYTDSTGYELKKIFDESLSYFWQASKSQIYKELALMEKEGFLSVKLVVQKDRPNKKLYALTKRGRNLFEGWLRADLDPRDFTYRENFMMKVFFWGEIEKKEAAAKLMSFIKIHQGKLDGYQSVPAHVDNYSAYAGRDKALFWEFTVRHGIAYSKTCIAWAREAMEMMEENNGRK